MHVPYCFDVVSSNFIALDRIAAAAYDVVFFAAGGDNLLGHEAAAIVKQAIPTVRFSSFIRMRRKRQTRTMLS